MYVFAEYEYFYVTGCACECRAPGPGARLRAAARNAHPRPARLALLTGALPHRAALAGNSGFSAFGRCINAVLFGVKHRLLLFFNVILY